MATPSRSAEREAERRFNMRTLAIASVASAAAALLTSQLTTAGTWIAAAMTPVIVSLVSEMLHRPTERIARSITADRRAGPGLGAATPARREADQPLLRVPDRRGGGAGRPPAGAPPFDRSRGRPGTPERIRPPGEPGGPRPDAPVRVYRAGSGGPATARRRKLAYGAVFGTAAVAFVIGVVAFTATELIAGESVGKSDRRTTLLGGGKGTNDTEREPQQQQQQQQTTPEEQPAPEEQTTPEEEPQPTTPAEEPTTPEETAPEETTTETTPAPGEPAPQSAPSGSSTQP